MRKLRAKRLSENRPPSSRPTVRGLGATGLRIGSKSRRTKHLGRKKKILYLLSPR